ncbi:uncharacterized protein [Misgurnus anguillicaudatus]|uniref:uncharacterized protein isoform X2 n=1 Tax=Misgurnus anguillicaudatus TaxID=75329 RepID=UPI003CCF82F5
MTSYWWIFLLGSLMVTGVKMQEDGAEGDGNAEKATEDAAPEEEKKSEDEPTQAATEDLPQNSDDTSPDAADGDGAADPPADAEEKTEGTPTETSSEDVTPEEEKKSEEEPTQAAEEEPAKEEGKDEDVPATTETVPDLPTESLPTEVTEPVIIPDQGAGDAKEEPDDEEPTEMPTAEDDGDAKKEEDSEKSQENPEITMTDEEMADSVQPVAGQGKVRSAGSVSGPNVSGGGSGTVIGVVCGVAVAAVVAIVGYFTYQNKKLCFKAQRGDPESGREENGTQSDPQVSSNLLTSS